jgi:polysaccharide biosynthesis protein PslH
MDSRPPLLYLVHRIPYPPNKGDKVRSFNLLRQLALNHRVHLGCFVDRPEDMQYVARLKEWCVDLHAVRLQPQRARIASLYGLVSGEALSLPYYRSAALHRWVEATVASNGISDAVVFSGPMAQYLDVPGLRRRVVDFCDVDSAKWTQYATGRRWPMSWLYRREGERLLAFERLAARRSDASVFVTESEAALFRRAAPEVADAVVAIQNGVDADYFSPAAAHDDPYPDGGPVILFTGAMDYWPNVDAVCWFAQEVLPRILERHPDARFYIAGMNPAPEVRALAGGHVFVTGMVADIRPWLAHADVVVAPLRVARGIQNKVLEAMAMGKAVVASTTCAAGLSAVSGRDLVTADGAEAFVHAVDALIADAPLRERTGALARECVLARYSWSAHFRHFDILLDGNAARTAPDSVSAIGARA